MDGRLAAGELHHASGYWLLLAQRRKHLADEIEVWLVHVACRVRVGEADRAGEVAAIGEINVRQSGVRGVHPAHAAVVGTIGGVRDSRILEAAIIAERPLFHLQVELHVGEDDVAEVAVLGAAFFHHDFAVVGEDVGVDYLAAFGAQRLGNLRQTFLKRRDRRARVSGLGLNHFEVGAEAFSHSGAAGSAFVRGCIHCFWRNGLCAHFGAPLNSDRETNLARIVLIF